MEENKNQNDTDIFVSELLKRLEEKIFSAELYDNKNWNGQTIPSLLLLGDVEQIARKLAEEMSIENWTSVQKYGHPKETGDYFVSILHYGNNRKEKSEPVEKVEIRHFYKGENTFPKNIWEHKGSPYENFEVLAYMPLPEFYKEQETMKEQENILEERE